MTNWWDQQIQRADHLVPRANGSKELLTFYAHLLRAQKAVYEFFAVAKTGRPSGELEADWPLLSESWPHFLKVVEAHGPTTLATEARELTETDSQVFADRLMVSG